MAHLNALSSFAGTFARIPQELFQILNSPFLAALLLPHCCCRIMFGVVIARRRKMTSSPFFQSSLLDTVSSPESYPCWRSPKSLAFAKRSLIQTEKSLHSLPLFFFLLMFFFYFYKVLSRWFSRHSHVNIIQHTVTLTKMLLRVFKRGGDHVGVRVWARCGCRRSVLLMFHITVNLKPNE